MLRAPVLIQFCCTTVLFLFTARIDDYVFSWQGVRTRTCLATTMGMDVTTRYRIYLGVWSTCAPSCVFVETSRIIFSTTQQPRQQMRLSQLCKSLLQHFTWSEALARGKNNTQLPMTHAPETGAINRLHFLAPVFGAGFSYHMRLERNFWRR